MRFRTQSERALRAGADGIIGAMGRNAVHRQVLEAVVEAYARAYAVLPDTKFVYGEMGWPSGDPFPRGHPT